MAPAVLHNATHAVESLTKLMLSWTAPGDWLGRHRHREQQDFHLDVDQLRLISCCVRCCHSDQGGEASSCGLVRAEGSTMPQQGLIALHSQLHTLHVQHTAQDPSFQGRWRPWIAELGLVRLVAKLSNRQQQLAEWAEPPQDRYGAMPGLL